MKRSSKTSILPTRAAQACIDRSPPEGIGLKERLVRQFPVYDALYAGRSKQGTVNRRPTRDLALANAAGFLRSFGVGLLGVVLGIYLSRVGLSSLEIGFVIAAGLAGSALATVVTSVAADRMGRRSFLVLLSFLTTIGGLALSLLGQTSPDSPCWSALLRRLSGWVFTSRGHNPLGSQIGHHIPVVLISMRCVER